MTTTLLPWTENCPSCQKPAAYHRRPGSTLLGKCPSCGYSERECEFTIIIDTREQLPYTFNYLWEGVSGESPRLVVPCVRGTLKTGDYSIVNHEDLVTIERKSKDDLWSSISQGRENFEERLERMQLFEFAAIVVETSWDKLLIQPHFTDYLPKSLSRTIQAWMIRYRYVQWIMLPNRAWAESFTFRLLQRFWIDKQEETNEPHRETRNQGSD